MLNANLGLLNWLAVCTVQDLLGCNERNPFVFTPQKLNDTLKCFWAMATSYFSNFCGDLWPTIWVPALPWLEPRCLANCCGLFLACKQAIILVTFHWRHAR